MPDANEAGRAARGAVVPTTGSSSLAVVGLACRFPDADDPAALLDAVLTGRRSFRRLPPGRIDLADYYQPDGAVSDATYSTRAAILEGWQFEREAFDIESAAYLAADPAHWLALETTARALAAAGLPAGNGLDLDRTGVIIGNTLTGDVSRANALRVRWPYVRKVLTEALDTQEIPANQADRVLEMAETGYLAPFPSMGSGSLAGSMPATIATGIGAFFGFRGGSHAVDAACSSSLQAVASACAALAAGDLDAAIAGGVDLSLDPLELIGLAKAGVLATTDVRIYDRDPTGYLPGEGCGVVVLMRTADARAAGLPVYAEILGWGTSGGSTPSQIASQASSQLLAMRRAYERASVDPADIQFIEGNGAATAAADAAELSALSVLRDGAKQRAAIGSIKANIGHAKAAAGAAGLIKTVLALGTGVIPPTTGVHQPHELIAAGDTGLVLPQSPEEWPDGSRLAAVSTMGFGGTNVHVVLRHEPGGGKQRHDRWLRSVPALARATPRHGHEGVQPRLQPEPEPTPFLVHARDKFALAAVLTRLADIAGSLSDAELQDLACMLGRDPGKQGRARVGIVATRQGELALLAREAVTLLPHLDGGLILARPGIFASDDADGRVTLLLSGDAGGHAGDVEGAQLGPVALTSGVAHCLDTLRWLDTLEVQPTGAVGHGIGALAGLAWAGVLGEAEVVEIADLRAQYLLRAAEYAESGIGVIPPGLASDPAGGVGLRAAIAQRFRFGPPRRRLISTMTGAEIESVDDAIDLICSGFAGAERLTDAVTNGAIGATLLVETGPGRILVSAAARALKVPAISLQSGFRDPENSSSVAAALFAAGALGQPIPLFAGRPARPIDIWRDQAFITNPCQVAPRAPTAADARDSAAADSVPASVAEHDIASKREEFERRLPKRLLLGEEATADSDPGADALSAETLALPAETPAAVPDPDPAADATPVAVPDPAADATPVAVPDPAADATPVADADPDPAADATPVADADAAPDETPVALAASDAVENDTLVVVADTDLANDATPGAVPDSTAGAAAAAAETPVPAAETPSVLANPATDADITAIDSAVPAPAETSADGKHVIVTKPMVLGEPVVPGKAKAEAPEPSAAAPEPASAEIAVRQGESSEPVNWFRPWTRCFTEGLRPVAAPATPIAQGSWRLLAAASSPMLSDLSTVFTDDPAAGRTLAILDGPAHEQSRIAAVKAARDGVATGELVVLTTSQQFSGFFASVQAEHPSAGVTILRVPAVGVAADAIRQDAFAEAGQFREIVLDADGVASEPALAEVALPGGGDVVLGPDDVILISRSTRGTGLALAQVLACCGAGIAIVGRAGEYDDTEFVIGLEKLRSAGARIGYEVIDIADRTSLAAAIRRVEGRLGKITALAHGASTDNPVPVLELTDAQIRRQLAAEISTIELIADSIRPGQLKLIISVGSVADRYGLAGSSVHALVSGALASRAGQLAEAGADCRHLHIDMPAWSDGRLGDRPELAIELAAAGAPALELDTVSRLLLKLLTTPALPDSVAVHGRIGDLPAAPAQIITRAELSAAGLPGGGRFLREVAVHYPGVELVCESTLSLASDPYLADYRVDGMPVLPPVLALEALAQAASVLAGRPLRRASNVTLHSPILIPAGGHARIRVCALREGNRIFAALRCADSTFRVDHARAEFSCTPSLPGLPDMPEAAFAAAPPALQQLVAGPADLVDGAELYGPISFQSGRFRRIALLPEVTARSARALARGADQQAWYPADSELAGTEFLLGSPALNDAALQVLQACVPHRRVRPAGCESVQFAGRSIDGPVEIRAVAEPVRWTPGNGDDMSDRDTDGISESGSAPLSEPGFAPAPTPAFVPGQAGAPEAETTSESAHALDALLAAPVPIARETTPEEPADMELGEPRPQSRKSRKSRKSRRQDEGSARRSDEKLSALHTWEVPASALQHAAPEPPTDDLTAEPLPKQPQTGQARAGRATPVQLPGVTSSTGQQPTRQPTASEAMPQSRHPTASRATPQSRQSQAAGSAAAHRTSASVPVPQLWNIEAVDAAGQLVATWRGVRLHDSGPLPRNAAWPPTLLSVFLERSLIDLGLDEGLRVTVSCGQPDGRLLEAGPTIPRQATVDDGRPRSRGRHAGPERRALNTASAVGAGALSGFGLAVRAPVPVACAWTIVEPGHRHRDLSPALASAFGQLRTDLAESPMNLSARLEAVGACLAMAGLAPDDRGASQLVVVRTTGDGWALLAMGRAQVACTIVEMSGVAAPIAIAISTRRHAHARISASRGAVPARM
jgi:enediyne polyketide synthase